ncbi:glycosyltransferase family 4 protein [Halarsenatibacter silvermanii]|uniref:Glycosyltransferase involved in cell wall bisynthesis n=1 Tax=Halarsenatibacter silvermanii TaxID=321763 RepID=A0A1G9S9Z6_9FIRM|nr:glycosyltransferase family 4 protein [Halarsenatibacter silvermanii]SDM32284.1 Glycosyltransferase involved in cell wall bisynthesis [Halarsenatibacter silvermanii]
MKKIVFFDSRYNLVYGAKKSMIKLAQNLDKNKYTSIMLTTSKGDFSNYSQEAGLDCDIIEASNSLKTFDRKILNYNFFKKILLIKDLLKYNFKIGVWLKNKKIDLMYVNNARSFFYVFIACFILRVPIVAYKRCTTPKNIKGVYDLMEKILLYFIDKYFCIAEGVRRDISKNLRQKHGEKIKVLYTGYDFDNFIYSNSENENKLYEKLNITQEDIVIGLVGTVNPRKGHHVAIEALSIIKEKLKQKTKLMFVGGGHDNEYFDELNNLAQKHGVERNLIWTGYVENVADYYDLMDILILPSYSEGLPRTIIEGLANGIPVVASDVGGINEILVSKEYGKVVKKGSSEELAAGIIETVKNNEIDIENNKKDIRSKFVMEKFSLEKYVNKFQREIGELF